MEVEEPSAPAVDASAEAGSSSDLMEAVNLDRVEAPDVRPCRSPAAWHHWTRD